MARRRKEKAIERRPPLTDREKELMLVVLIRSREAFEAARSQLSWEHFNEYETYLSIVWQVVCEHFEEHNELPAEEHILTAINARMEEDAMLLADEEGQEIETLNHFLAWTFRMDESALREKVAMGYLRRFLQERLASDLRDTFSEGYMPASMFGLMQNFTEQASEIEVLASTGLDEPFAAGWDSPEEVPLKYSTGLTFLDKFMGGGAAVGESHGVLGPYQGGKTTLFVQLSVLAASDSYVAWDNSGEKDVLKISYYFTWEEPPYSLRIRALSMLGRIRRDNLEEALENQDYTLLSTTDALKDYERRKWADALERGQTVPGEHQRFKEALKQLNYAWRIIDMTGNDPKHPGRGAGLVDEVAQVIRQDQELRRRAGQNCAVASVFTDYVGAAAERHIDTFGVPRNDLRHLISKWPYHMKQKVAVPFKCPAWSAHQLSTKANAFCPGVIPKHTDSAEGRAFAENPDFCFVLGTATRDNILLCACTKYRRRDRPKRPTILKLNGALSRMDDQSTEYVVKGGDIVRRDEARQFTDGSSGESDSPGGDIPSDADNEAVASQQQAVNRSSRGVYTSGRA